MPTSVAEAPVVGDELAAFLGPLPPLLAAYPLAPQMLLQCWNLQRHHSVSSHHSVSFQRLPQQEKEVRARPGRDRDGITSTVLHCAPNSFGMQLSFMASPPLCQPKWTSAMRGPHQNSLESRELDQCQSGALTVSFGRGSAPFWRRSALMAKRTGCSCDSRTAVWQRSCVDGVPCCPPLPAAGCPLPSRPRVSAPTTCLAQGLVRVRAFRLSAFHELVIRGPPRHDGPSSRRRQPGPKHRGARPRLLKTRAGKVSEDGPHDRAAWDRKPFMRCSISISILTAARAGCGFMYKWLLHAQRCGCCCGCGGERLGQEWRGRGPTPHHRCHPARSRHRPLTHRCCRSPGSAGRRAASSALHCVARAALVLCARSQRSRRSSGGSRTTARGRQMKRESVAAGRYL